MKKIPAAKERFPHRSLKVYHLASDYFVKCWRFADGFPPRDVFLRSQFLRAALSIKLNIAEGASEFSPAEKARFYRMSRRSAAEVAALLDDFPRTIGTREEDLESFYEDGFMIGTLLTNLILSMEDRTPPKRPAPPTHRAAAKTRPPKPKPKPHSPGRNAPEAP